MNLLLSLDMSTTCTGWSIFDIDSKSLLHYGTIKPSTKYQGRPISKLTYPLQQLCKMLDIADQIRHLISTHEPSEIVIEEITGSKNRHGQKVLDGLHWIVLYHIQEDIPRVRYFDVSGSAGWRTVLGIKLSEQDKVHNKEAKKLNKIIGRGEKKIAILDAKDLACRYANSHFGTSLDVQERESDGDIADSVSMGSAFLEIRLSSDQLSIK
jgi:Holliday junction resolvasome RuvABC endonuclease subunit